MFTLPLNLYIALPLLLAQYLLARWLESRLKISNNKATGYTAIIGIGFGSIASFFSISWLFFLWKSGNLLPHQLTPGIADILLLLIVIPLIEEYLFRGVIFSWLTEYFRPTTIIIILSVIFILTHPGDQLLLLIFIVNIICGIARHITGTFISSFICRVIYNISIFLLLNNPVFFINNNKLMYLPLIIGSILLITGSIINRTRTLKKK